MRMPTRRPAPSTVEAPPMMRREVFTRLREGGGNGNTDMHLELDPADHEEPTWEVRQPGVGRKRRLDGRTRIILGIAAAAAIVVNAGAAWVYWQITDAPTASSADGAAVEMVLRARSDLSRPLRRGTTGDLTVTVTNDNDFPIRITSLAGAGTITADEAHIRAGCTSAAVKLTRPPYGVRWEVRRNTIGAFTVEGGLVMRPDARKACEGATFIVPLRASGVRQGEG